MVKTLFSPGVLTNAHRGRRSRADITLISRAYQPDSQDDNRESCVTFRWDSTVGGPTRRVYSAARGVLPSVVTDLTHYFDKYHL